MKGLELSVCPVVHWPQHGEDFWIPVSCISVLVALTTSALHHSMSRDCLCVYLCVCERVCRCTPRTDILYACRFCSWLLLRVYLCAQPCSRAWSPAFGRLWMCVCGHRPHTRTHTHISISSIVVLTVLCHAWTSPPFPHIYAKLGSCQSVTLVTWSPTSPIRADRAGLGGGRAPADLPTCQSRAGHPHACLLSDPISVCQTARQPSPREERRRVGGRRRGGRRRSDRN